MSHGKRQVMMPANSLKATTRKHSPIGLLIEVFTNDSAVEQHLAIFGIKGRHLAQRVVPNDLLNALACSLQRKPQAVPMSPAYTFTASNGA
jgi:hypothetical protein